MPPTCGLGFSERVFWIFEGVTAREGVPFPQLRHEIDEVTKTIYPDIKFEQKKPSSKPSAPKDLPESAAEEGTKKLYLDDYSLLQNTASILDVQAIDDGKYRLILNQSCLYPGGGGQDPDLGVISWDGGKLDLTQVSKDKSGVVYHDGVLQGSLPKVGDEVECKVDAQRRMLNSRLHCAGHLIDYALQKIGKDWEPGRGSHYPGRSFVEYKGEFNPQEVETLSTRIAEILAGLSKMGGPIKSTRVPSGEAHQHSKYIPQAIINAYKNVHVAQYPDGFEICCGGTHLTDVSQLGEVKITKIKKKDGNIRVSYDVD
jgi:Ser-tRNA(Ala) deacylase AlaX